MTTCDLFLNCWNSSMVLENVDVILMKVGQKWLNLFKWWSCKQKNLGRTKLISWWSCNEDVVCTDFFVGPHCRCFKCLKLQPTIIGCQLPKYLRYIHGILLWCKLQCVSKCVVCFHTCGYFYWSFKVWTLVIGCFH